MPVKLSLGSRPNVSRAHASPRRALTAHGLQEVLVSYNARKDALVISEQHKCPALVFAKY